MKHTKKGHELADKLRSHVHEHVDVGACSGLCRAATSYARVQEARCNGHPACSSPTMPIETIRILQAQWEERVEHEDARLQSLILRHAKALPMVSGVVFGGDPRGATVKLRLDDGRYDDWGREGICVPGS